MRKFNLLLIVMIMFTFVSSFNLRADSAKPRRTKDTKITKAPIGPLKCVLKLYSISKTSGYPGDTYEMHGSFGPTQGVKMPTLNKGKSNELIVLFWSASKLIVKIPGNFPPGMYKTGVYCSDPCAPGVGINTSGMVWRDFEVLSNLKISDPPVLKKKK